MPKWRSKTFHAIQMQLSKLAKYDLEFVNQLLDNSIMNGWQGLIYKDTDEQYEKWKRQQGAQYAKSNQSQQDMLDYLNETF